MKKALTVFTLCFLAVLQMNAQRSWEPLSNNDASVASETVVYGTLQDASGNQVVPGENITVMLGAFVGDECRAIARPVQSNDGKYIYTLRIPVKKDETDKTVNFVLNCNDTEYTLEETIKVSDSGDKTFYYPSSPLALSFTPAERISMSTISINKGDKVNLTDYMTIYPEAATLPDNGMLTWDFANSSTFINVKNGVLEGLAVTSDAYLGLQAFYSTSGQLSAYTSVTVNQPIEGIEVITETITVNIYDVSDLTAKLKKSITVTPSDATEEVRWEPSDWDAIEQGEDGDGNVGWMPCKTGTYTMTATCDKEGVKGEVTLIIRQPVTELKPVHDEITVLRGEKVNQYLPFTYTISPENATDSKAGIHYDFFEDSNNETIFTKDEDGNIIANAVGDGIIYIKHDDIPNNLLRLTVHVVHLPSEQDFSISANPLTIDVPENEISSKDITETLKGNIKTGPYDWNDLTWAENPGEKDPILQITNGDVTASDQYLTKAYGSTRFEGTMEVSACGFEEDGTFTPKKIYSFTIGFAVNITETLSAISFESIHIGCEDQHELTITTTPEGYNLENVEFTIPETSDGHPIFKLEPKEGAINTWTLTPLLVGEGELMAEVGSISTSGTVKITQHINATEGWNWISLYAGQVGAGVFEKYFNSVQEIRSQSDLVYNDPSYGFFGTLQSLDGTSCYKINVKEEQELNYLVEGKDLYTNRTKVVNLRPGWNWFNNPYCKDHPFMEVFGKVTTLAEGSMVVAQNAFMTYTGRDWNGLLSSFDAGKGYLIYNAGNETATFELNPDIDLTEYVPDVASAKAYGTVLRPELTYNYRQFADNMTIIASLSEKVDDGQYSIWAFVGDECRGEGKMIDGRFFITVGGKNNETVTFKLFDTTTGEFIPVDDAVSFTKTLGTYAKPAAFSYTVTGIRDIADAEGAQEVKAFNLNGQQVNGNAKGLLIIGGKKVVKK